MAGLLEAYVGVQQWVGVDITVHVAIIFAYPFTVSVDWLARSEWLFNHSKYTVAFKDNYGYCFVLYVSCIQIYMTM